MKDPANRSLYCINPVANQLTVDNVTILFSLKSFIAIYCRRTANKTASPSSLSRKNVVAILSRKRWPPFGAMKGITFTSDLDSDLVDLGPHGW